MESNVSTEQPKKRGRGAGKKPSLVHVNLRVPQEVINYYRGYSNYTGKMREVLTAYANHQAPPDAN